MLTGRPVNLGSRSIPPAEFGQRLKAGEKIGALLRRGADETDVPLHAERVLQDGAARLERFLRQCGVPTDPTFLAIYDGGNAPTAPMSHKAHARDFLFDRKDLVDRAAFARPAPASSSSEPAGPSEPAVAEPGQVVSPGEYRGMLAQLDAMSAEGRAAALLAVLRPYALRPMRALLEELGGGPMDFIVGGPATSPCALLDLGGPAVHAQLRTVHMMGGAWDNGKPGSVNIFDNQFNLAADMEAARRLLTHPSAFGRSAAGRHGWAVGHTTTTTTTGGRGGGQRVGRPRSSVRLRM